MIECICKTNLKSYSVYETACLCEWGPNQMYIRLFSVQAKCNLFKQNRVNPENTALSPLDGADYYKKKLL